jgi:hypothetical protein
MEDELKLNFIERIKFAWLRIRYMNCISKVENELKASGIIKLTKKEEYIAANLCKIGENPIAIANILMQRKMRNSIVKELKNLGFSSLTDDEFKLIESLIKGTGSISDIVDRIKTHRSKSTSNSKNTP